MTARQLRRRISVVICAGLSPSIAGAQGTPLHLGPLTVAVPAGWAAQTNVVPVRMYSPESNPARFFSAQFFPPEQTSQDLRQHHAEVFGRMAATLQVRVMPQSGVLGQFIWTRVDVPRPGGQRETLILYSAKTGSLYMAIGVDANRADLVAKHLPAFEAMVRTATLADGGPTPGATAAPAVAGAPTPSAAPPGAGSPATLGEYVYTMPPGWTANQYPDGLVLMSPMSATNERCVFTLWPMRPAGGNLVADANAIFQDVYKTFEPRNQTVRGTAMPPTVTRGTSGQGWDYAIVRRGVAPPGSPESRLAFVLVAKLNNRLAVISGVSRDPLVSTCMGELAAGNVWPRFFYSLSFKSWNPVDDAGAMRKRIAGVWTTATATAADRFVFAANGRYAGAAAAQQYARISSTELLTTTQAYFGNGAYTLRGNAITLTGDDGRPPESGFIRVEEESKDDGRTWVESLYLLRTSVVDGKDYEVRYSKN